MNSFQKDQFFFYYAIPWFQKHHLFGMWHTAAVIGSASLPCFFSFSLPFSSGCMAVDV
jgi:hypothetical protein